MNAKEFIKQKADEGKPFSELPNHIIHLPFIFYDTVAIMMDEYAQQFLLTEQARSVVQPEVMPNEVVGGGRCDYFVSFYWEIENENSKGFWSSVVIDQEFIINQKGIDKLNEIVRCGMRYTKVVIINYQLVSRREA